jgi:peptide/nickel transport system permease protein
VSLAGEEVQVAAIGRLRAILQAIGWGGLLIVAIVAALSDFLARAPANTQGIGASLEAPSLALPFGTDDLGRDILGEVVHALSITVQHALVAAVITIALGSFAGYGAARTPKPLGIVLRWAVGLFASVPGLLLAILLVGLSTKDFAAIAAGLGAAPIAFARAYDRTHRKDFSAHAKYARATGISPASLLRRDLTFEFRNNFLQSAARAIAAVTIMLSTASFLGFGATPPHRDLGLMIAAARPNYLSAWWTAAFPALALTLLILFARLAAGLEEGERP